MTSIPPVQTAGISKAFGGVQALDNLSMDIAEGEVHALVGENGVGKSTQESALQPALTAQEGQ
jgi:ABC-type sugar transport system ATPase subunit